MVKFSHENCSLLHSIICFIYVASKNDTDEFSLSPRNGSHSMLKMSLILFAKEGSGNQTLLPELDQRIYSS